MPCVTVAVSSLLVACLLFQLAVPATLSTLERSASHILAGQWWRVLTALFVQDRWVSGGLLNGALLLSVGAVAEQHFSRTLWLAIYLIGGVLSELLALTWQPVGAGNSIACCALAGSLLVLSKPRRVRYLCALLAGLSACAAGVLLVKHNIHGQRFSWGLFWELESSLDNSVVATDLEAVPGA